MEKLNAGCLFFRKILKTNFYLPTYFIFYSCNEDKLLEPQSGDLNSLDTPQVIHKRDAVLEAIDFLNKHFNTSYDNPAPNSTMSTASHKINYRGKSIDTIYEIKGLLNKNKTILKLICFLPSGYALINALESTTTPPVLYYSEGTFTEDDINPGLSLYINHFIEVIEKQSEYQNAYFTDSEGSYTFLCNREVIEEQVGPLLKTFWKDGAPFNKLMPIVEGNKKAAVGCLAAIALGQIIAHNKRYDNVPGKYDWDKLLSKKRNRSNDEEKAKLIKEISDGVNTVYGENGSSAFMSAGATYLRQVVGHNNAVLVEYTFARLKNLLNNKKPAVVGAGVTPINLSDQYPRHGWVIDGYKVVITKKGCRKPKTVKNTFVHMNWGWGKKGNGKGWCLENSDWKKGGGKYNIDRNMIMY